MSDSAKSTITMIATMVIAVAAIIGVTLGVLAPAIESNRQEIRETRTELLRAIEKSEERVLDAVGGHSHDADGNPRFNRPVSHEGAVAPQ